MSIRTIPNRFDDSPVAFHAINKCFLRAGSEAITQLKRHLASNYIDFRYVGDLLVQEDRFIRTCADYKLFSGHAKHTKGKFGPFVFIISAESHIWHHVDHGLEAYLGYTREELENDWVIAYHPDSCQEAEERFNNVLRALHRGDRNYAELEVRYQTKPGYSVWAKQTMSLIRDWRGEPENFLIVLRDISMRKWTQQLYQELSQLKGLMDECGFCDRSADWIDGLLKHYNGEPVDGHVMHQIRVLVRDLV